MKFFSHIAVASSLRVCLLLFGSYQDQNYAVKYTDIDYHVFTDASRLLYNGQSPFDRHTYRYTPLLAALLVPNVFLFFSFGKILFLLFDVLTGWLIYEILRNYEVDYKTSKMSACLWLYNPISAVVSTRGSTDTILTVLVMSAVWLLQKNKVIWSALTYGIAVHFRIYPCIYALSLYSVLTNYPSKNCGIFHTVYHMLVPNKNKVKFVFFSALSFIIPTVLGWYLYGWTYIEEAYLYHLTRKDIKHNFSPYFYFVYLMEGSTSSFSFLSVLPFVFQMLLLAATSFVFCRKEVLPMCLFALTFIFVTFNKVCTSQYFLWYLSLFPLCMPLLKLNFKSAVLITLFWFSGQILWLAPAYLLEFQAQNVFFVIWCASLYMFLSYTYLLYCFWSSCPVYGYDVKSKKKE